MPDDWRDVGTQAWEMQSQASDGRPHGRDVDTQAWEPQPYGLDACQHGRDARSDALDVGTRIVIPFGVRGVSAP